LLRNLKTERKPKMRTLEQVRQHLERLKTQILTLLTGGEYWKRDDLERAITGGLATDDLFIIAIVELNGKEIGCGDAWEPESNEAVTMVWRLNK
jgi:hypothetical protein